MQTQNRLFDDVARVAGGALGALTGVRDEIEGIVRHRLERILSEMDLVTRDEFEAVKAMAAEARAENEHLAARIEELEEALKRRAASAPASSATQGRRQSTQTTRRASATASTAATRMAGVEPEGDVENGGEEDTGGDDTKA